MIINVAKLGTAIKPPDWEKNEGEEASFEIHNGNHFLLGMVLEACATDDPEDLHNESDHDHYTFVVSNKGIDVVQTDEQFEPVSAIRVDWHELVALAVRMENMKRTEEGSIIFPTLLSVITDLTTTDIPADISGMFE